MSKPLKKSQEGGLLARKHRRRPVQRSSKGSKSASHLPINVLSRPDSVLALQQSVGNRSVTEMIQRNLEGVFDPGGSPLADYPHLRTALSPDNFARLEDAANRRLALGRGETYDGPPGIDHITVSVGRMLPATVEYVSREDLITTFYHQLATVDGPSPNLDYYVHLIAKSETLREYLEDKLALPVQIVLEDPGGKRDSSTQLRFEKLNQSQANLHPFNADFTGNLMELVTAASEI
ncbi:MAG: hypothetical protein WAM60_13735, partial [Candidatus Promineifilaceae bacterium]